MILVCTSGNLRTNFRSRIADDSKAHVKVVIVILLIFHFFKILLHRAKVMQYFLFTLGYQ